MLYGGKSRQHCGCCTSTFDAHMVHVVMWSCAIPYSLFIVFISIPLGPSPWYPFALGAIVLWLTKYTLAILGANTNPGIIAPGTMARPTLTECTQEMIERKEYPDYGNVRGISLLPGDVLEAVGPKLDNIYLRRYCTACNIVRPPLVSHCPHCNYCVHRFDHHCTVLGCCVGERTWRYFTYFLVVATVSNAYAFSVTVAFLALRYKTLALNTDLGRWTLTCTIGMLIFTMWLGCGLFMMTMNYLRLTMQGRTQRDDPNVHAPYWDRAKGFPFDRGCWNNCVRKMCFPRSLDELAAIPVV